MKRVIKFKEYLINLDHITYVREGSSPQTSKVNIHIHFIGGDFITLDLSSIQFSDLINQATTYQNES